MRTHAPDVRRRKLSARAAVALLAAALLATACATTGPGKRIPTEPLAPRAYDKHRSIQIVAASTAAIVETSYYQANIEYLLEGSERALLIDSGPGIHAMAPVVQSLTDLPITVVPSHLHFDHVGGLGEFADVALLDVEDLRERTVDGRFQPTPVEHLGWLDRDPARAFQVARWLQHGERIDLGGRTVEVLHTPGHTKTSAMIYDAQLAALFTGDFLYPGGLFVESLRQYRDTLDMLLARMPEDVTIYPAHNGRGARVTTLGHQDLRDLHRAVSEALAGKLEGKPANAFGIPSTAYPVNKRLNMFVLQWPSSPADLKPKDAGKR